MVNLVAGRSAVPELMQNEVRGDRLAAEALRLLEDPGARERMRVSYRSGRQALRGIGSHGAGGCDREAVVESGSRSFTCCVVFWLDL